MRLEYINTRVNEIKHLRSKGQGDKASQLEAGLLRQFTRDIATGEQKGDETLAGAKMIIEEIL